MAETPKYDIVIIGSGPGGGIADNTIVMYSTDNGPHMNSWPDGAMTPFPQREELQLGGRLPGAGHGALARQDQARHRVQ